MIGSSISNHFIQYLHLSSMRFITAISIVGKSCSCITGERDETDPSLLALATSTFALHTERSVIKTLAASDNASYVDMESALQGLSESCSTCKDLYTFLGNVRLPFLHSNSRADEERVVHVARRKRCDCDQLRVRAEEFTRFRILHRLCSIIHC